MCFLDPVSMGIISLVGTVGSAVMGGVSAVQQANSQNAMLEYNARVAENNAKAAQAEAERVRQQALRNANEERKMASLRIGAQRAKMGASGALVDSGSFLDSILATREQGELKAMSTIEEGDMGGWNLERQRDNYLQSAAISRGSKVSTGGVLAGSILSGMAGVGSAYFDLKDNGVFDTGKGGKAMDVALGAGSLAKGLGGMNLKKL